MRCIRSLFGLWLIAALAVGCGAGGGNTSSPPPPQAATPSFSIGTGTYTTLQSVAISDSTAGANIHYTTDGSAPTDASDLYEAPIPVATNTTIKALATESGYTDSSVASATYIINLPAAPPIAAVTDIHQGFI